MKGSIVDRRKNPKGKNLPNRQRFLGRYKKQIEKSIKEKIVRRSLTDDGDEAVTIPTDGVGEPNFRHTDGLGDRDWVIPGNVDFVPGDTIPKPMNGQQGTQGSEDGEGEDDFEFLISASEYHDLLFDGLDLPNLKKKSLNEIMSYTTRRAGYTAEGTPNNLDLLRSMKNSLSRKIALKNPKLRKIKELEEEIEELEKETPKNDELIEEKRQKISSLRIMANAVSFLDPIDLKYKNYVKQPKPTHQAVMFCVMDVSASMGPFEKEMAKRFYLLLYLFLNTKYEKVDVIFIRHHTTAKECDEEDFFNSKETGGTVVSTGFELMCEIQQDRYPEKDWNIYVAQASDGDNFQNDNERLLDIINTRILPIVQYFAYIQIDHSQGDMFDQTFGGYFGMGYAQEDLWRVYEDIKDERFNKNRIFTADDIFPVFRNIFKKDKETS